MFSLISPQSRARSHYGKRKSLPQKLIFELTIPLQLQKLIFESTVPLKKLILVKKKPSPQKITLLHGLLNLKNYTLLNGPSSQKMYY